MAEQEFRDHMEDIAREQAFDMKVEELKQASGYQFEGNKLIREGKELTYEAPENGKDKAVDQAYKYFEGQYDENELDSKRTIKSAMNSEWVGTKGPDDQLYLDILKNAEGKIEQSALYAILKTRSRNFKEGQTSFIFDGYRPAGEGKESEDLFIASVAKSMERAKGIAEKAGEKLNYYVVEAEGNEKGLYDKAGCRRLFIKTGDGAIKELPYVQSILADDWNEKSGKPRRGKENVPEHLMISAFDGRKDMSKEDVMEVIQSVMFYDSVQAPEYFGEESEEGKAYQAHLQKLEADLRGFESFLGQSIDGRVMLLAEEDINALKVNKELEMSEHKAIDELEEEKEK